LPRSSAPWSGTTVVHVPHRTTMCEPRCLSSRQPRERNSLSRSRALTSSNIDIAIGTVKHGRRFSGSRDRATGGSTTEPSMKSLASASDSSAHAFDTTPVPGNRSMSSSQGSSPRHSKSQAQNASVFGSGRSPPPRAGMARSQSRFPGRSCRPPTTISGSQVLCRPRVSAGPRRPGTAPRWPAQRWRRACARRAFLVGPLSAGTRGCRARRRGWRASRRAGCGALPVLRWGLASARRGSVLLPLVLGARMPWRSSRSVRVALARLAWGIFAAGEGRRSHELDATRALAAGPGPRVGLVHPRSQHLHAA
jgi:hypothetical protein